MQRVDVRLLGPPSVAVDGRPAPLRNRGELLLARLVLEAERPIARDALAAWAWPAVERGAALHSLREALFKLRAALGDDLAGEPLLVVDRATVTFRPNAGLRCDVLDVLEKLARVRRHAHRRASACEACLTTLREALALWRGPLLGDAAVDVGEEAARWVESWRDRLDAARAGALGTLGEAALDDGRLDEALALAEAQLELEPWDEEAHRRVLRAHARAGRPGVALAHYAAYAERLDAALGAAPDAATEELAERLRHGEPIDGEGRPERVDAVPAAPNAFVGREPELAWIAGRLADPATRWITLVGPGGIGKSRLAQEAARRLGGRFRDGAHFVALAGVGTPEEVPTAVAAALDVQLTGAPPMRVVGEWLRGREVLLVLDNLEHLGDAAATFRWWLDRAPNLRVLATSRERFGLYAEHVLPLAGLETAADDDWAAPALQLWAARVRQVAPFRRLDAEEARGAAAVARLVDGLPLAIELAAEAAEGVDAAAIARRIEADLAWLVSAHRDAAPHHRALSVVAATTWARLDPGLATALERLAAFVGRFDLASARAVAGADADVLARLADRSLVRDEGGGRWSVHAVLRWSAKERAGEAWEGGLRRHAEWHAEWLARAGEGLRRQRDPAERDAVAAAWDDVRAAWRFAVERRDEALVARMADGLAWFAAWRGWVVDGSRLLEEAIGVLPGDGPLRARLAAHQGLLAWRCGLAEVAVRHLEGALAVAERDGDATLRARVLTQLGAVRRNQGSREEARVLLEAAFAAAEAVGGLEAADAAYRLAVARYERDELAGARAMLERAIALYEAEGSPATATHAMAPLGLTRVRLGDPGGVAGIRDALRAVRRHGWFGAGDVANCLALALVLLERWGEAARAARTAEDVYATLGFRPGIATARLWQAVAAAERGELDAARALARRTADVALALGTARTAAEALVAIAAVEAREGRVAAAARIAARLAAEPDPPSPDGARVLARLLAAAAPAPAPAAAPAPAPAPQPDAPTPDLPAFLLDILAEWERSPTAR